MYTLIIVLNICGKDVYELINVNEPLQYFKDGNITRFGKSALLGYKPFEHYSEDAIMECKCIRSFATEKIPEFNIK